MLFCKIRNSLHKLPSSNFKSFSTNQRLLTFLSEEKAKSRFAHFEKSHPLSYDVVLKLKKGDQYEGRVNVDFGLNKVSKDFFLDYAGLKVDSLKINKDSIDSKESFEERRSGRFLNLPGDALSKGRNLVSIKFSNDYTKDGNGLHTFTDTDSRQYVYSNNEPYHCNKIFPCFDQPDLKGTFKLTVLAPKDWTVISSELSGSQQNLAGAQEFLRSDEKDKYNIWTFNPTKPLSSYLYTVIGGPYLEIKNKTPYNNIPMSLFSRESLFPHLQRQADELFEITIESMKWFEKFFGYPFPFSKYDQIFCPEYNMGAMENPGAVTFNDKYVFKEEVTRRAKSNRANTISHELSHMWFGDLVTMKWWNDLWLNESFADFISHLCLARVNLRHTQLEDSWHMFFQRKGWAYREDQLQTTHPIATEVPNTERAENIFDGITYSKGAATVKQLLCLIGEENFGRAMSKYFKEFEWSNTTLEDFIKHLQMCYNPTDPSYPKDLKLWQKDWLETAGLNEAKPHWDSVSKVLKITQGVALANHPTLRFHKMKVAFFDENAKVYHSEDIVVKNQQNTQIEFQKLKKNPSAILLNYQDEAFIKVRLDQDSINFFKSNLGKVEDELTRAIIWRSIWDMVRDGELSSIDLIDVVTTNFADEKQDNLLSIILQYSKAAITEFTPKKIRDYFNNRMFEAVYRMLRATDPKNENRVILLRGELIRFACDNHHFRLLYEWSNKNWAELKNYEVGVNDRWEIVKTAFRDKSLDLKTKEEIFNKAASIDPTDTKTYMRKFCDALIANESQKAEIWQKIMDPNSKESNHLMAEIMRGFNDESNIEMTKPYYEQYWKLIGEVFQTRSREHSKNFFNCLFPLTDNLDLLLEKANNALDKCSNDQMTLKKLLQEKTDDLKRKIKAYGTFIKSLRE